MESSCVKIEKCKNKLKRYQNALQGYKESIEDITAKEKIRMSSAKDFFEACAESMWKMMKFFNEELFLYSSTNSPKDNIDLFCSSIDFTLNEKELVYHVLDLRNRSSHEYDSEEITLKLYYNESLSYLYILEKLEEEFFTLSKEYLKN